MAEARDDSITDDLNELYQYDENDDCDDHNGGIKALIPITHGKVTETAAPDDA